MFPLKFKFVDLFCGIGGFHQAMTSLGGECVFACDIDEACQKTYFKNYGIKPVGDIKKVAAEDIPEHDVLCGGFPCQAFSIAGKRLGFSDPTKGTLFFDIMRIVHHHHPKYLLLENVRNLASHDGGNTWKIIHQSLVDAGYNVSASPVIFSPHYIGIPQHRERVFILGVRKDIGELPPFYYNRKKAKPCSIYTILQDDSEIKNIKKYQMKQYDIDIVNHWNTFLAGVRKKLKKLPGFPVADMFLFPDIERFDLPNMHYEKAMFARRNVELFNIAPAFITQWLAEAYKLPKFRGSKRMLEWHAGNPVNPDLWETVLQFRQSGIRARAASHFPTLTAVAQTPIIGRRKRKLTPRECARLQSFPDSFICDPIEHEAYKQFGNSVNVEVVKLFARFLLGDEEVQKTYQKTEEDILAEKPKKRGRPRKVYPPGQEPKRGRPRKHPLPDPNVPVVKRKRGRPRKHPINVEELLFSLSHIEEIEQLKAIAIPSSFDEEELQPQLSMDDIETSSFSADASSPEEYEEDDSMEMINEEDEDGNENGCENAQEIEPILVVEEPDKLTPEELEYWRNERKRLEELNKVMLAEDDERRAILRANGYRDPNRPKRKRGRPRKYEKPAVEVKEIKLSDPQQPAVKRKRGRPRKYPLPEELL